jgi:serine/threonine-protein kinase
MNCPACGRAAGAARFCPECGVSLDPSQQSPTRTIHAGAGATGSAAAPSSRAGGVSSSDSVDYGLFVPGTVVAERYRVLGLLGRGGMGEVYRAEDFKLGQQVALKFLPPELARDPSRLARFHAEVRLARQVSHPNVCRVYDIGEIDGQTYLTMEYIDGEDLSTLLRRIGRLPKDKAIEIARQLCAGLAAAHERGVLHRDLKPANVMLDGRGRARITDFGLAGVVGVVEAGGTRAGTPAYMAPEQLTGGEGTVASDIYALGLVLYEVFTGKRAFKGETLAELRRSREDSTPTPPSTLVEGFDPAVERVLLRCLEQDPRQRPKSALLVAAALPGGDPLAMALAAGETPSPEMVAAAGEAGGLRPALVWVCLAAVVAGSLGVARLAERVTLLRRVDPPKAIDVLVDRAQEMIRRIGYTDPPVGTAYGLGWHRTYMEYIRDHDPSPSRWERLTRPQPTVIYVWYRQSPRRMEAANVAGEVRDEDPPPILPGMVQVSITAGGELWRFDAVPPQLDEGGPSSAAVDWAPIFALAGLRLEDFKPVEGRWVPPIYADARFAWEGHYAEVSEFPARVEAASYRGRPVYFHVYWPWNRPLRSQPFEASTGEKVADNIVLSLILSAFVAGLVLARRNIRLGRIDRKGAFRLAAAIFVANMVVGLCLATHSPTPMNEWDLITRLFGRAFFSGFLVWLYYIALEPHVRRHWPDRIISWTRLLGGRLRDPMVGRDLLVGMAFGATQTMLGGLAGVLPSWFGHPPEMPVFVDIQGTILGPAHWIAALASLLDDIVNQSLLILFLLLLLRILLRRQWAAAIGLFAFAAAALTLGDFQGAGSFAIVGGCAVAALVTIVLVRFGLLALAASLLTWRMLFSFPVSFGLATWYGLPGAFALVVLAALVIFAAHTALAGRSLFEARLLEE